MLTTVYWLADVDGTLCVAARTPDVNAPQYSICYWPTKARTSVVLSNYEMKPEELRDYFRVNGSGGLYHAAVKANNWQRGFDLELVEGGRTKAVKIECEPIRPPRVGKGTLVEWSFGRWRVVPPKGKPRFVEV